MKQWYFGKRVNTVFPRCSLINKILSNETGYSDNNDEAVSQFVWLNLDKHSKIIIKIIRL